MARTRFGADTDLYCGTGILASWPELKPGAVAKAEEIVTIVDRFNKEEAAILTSPMLTQQGKTDQLGRLATDSKRQFDAFEAATVAVLRKRVADAVEAVTLAAVLNVTKRDPGEALVHELRQRETRDAARQMDALMLRAKYLTACKDGSDDGLVAAVESAPSCAALLDASVIAEGKLARVARLRPNVESFEALISFYSYILASARNEIKRHLPPAEPQLLKVQSA